MQVTQGEVALGAIWSDSQIIEYRDSLQNVTSKAVLEVSQSYHIKWDHSNDNKIA